jgi:chorismate mutase
MRSRPGPAKVRLGAMPNAIRCRGIRGATTAFENSESSILESTRDLLTNLLSANQLVGEQVAAVFFTCTPDLDATFPARAARDLGFVHLPLMCSQEIDVPGAPQRCIRVLLLVNTDRSPTEMRHVYLRGAAGLRSDLSPSQDG